FDYLGLNEDNIAQSLRPDCADFVYFLRAYFAFKMGLPFGYSNCSRGVGGSPPRCYDWFDVMHPAVTPPAPPPERVAAAADPPPPNYPLSMFSRPQAAPPPPKPQAPPKKLGLVATFAQYLRAVGDVVHTGSVRSLGTQDNTDFYMVPLTEQS